MQTPRAKKRGQRGITEAKIATGYMIKNLNQSQGWFSRPLKCYMLCGWCRRRATHNTRTASWLAQPGFVGKLAGSAGLCRQVGWLNRALSASWLAQPGFVLGKKGRLAQRNAPVGQTWSGKEVISEPIVLFFSDRKMYFFS